MVLTVAGDPFQSFVRLVVIIFDVETKSQSRSALLQVPQLGAARAGCLAVQLEPLPPHRLGSEDS